MELILAIILGLGLSELSNNRNRKNDDEDNSKTFTKTTSGYDSLRRTYWELEQKYRISDD